MSPVVYLVAVLGIVLAVVCARFFGEKAVEELGTEEDILQAVHHKYPEFQGDSLVVADDRTMAMVFDKEHKELVLVFPFGLFVIARKLKPEYLKTWTWNEQDIVTLRTTDIDRDEYSLSVSGLSDALKQQWQSQLEQWSPQNA